MVSRPTFGGGPFYAADGFCYLGWKVVICWCIRYAQLLERHYPLEKMPNRSLVSVALENSC